MGSLYFGIDRNQTGFQNATGALFFMVSNGVWANMGAVNVFLTEKTIFLHERDSGYFRDWVWFISKVLADLIPTRVIPVTIFGTVCYWMMGLNEDFSRYLLAITALVLTSVNATSLAFMVSSFVSVPELGSLVLGILYILFMLLGGLYLNTEDVPVYVVWLQFFSMFKYGYEIALASHMDGLSFSCTTAELASSYCVQSGTVFLDSQGMSLDNVVKNVVILASLSLCYLTIAHMILKRQRLQ